MILENHELSVAFLWLKSTGKLSEQKNNELWARKKFSKRYGKHKNKLRWGKLVIDLSCAFAVFTVSLLLLYSSSVPISGISSPIPQSKADLVWTFFQFSESKSFGKMNVISAATNNFAWKGRILWTNNKKKSVGKVEQNYAQTNNKINIKYWCESMRQTLAESTWKLNASSSMVLPCLPLE